MMTFVWGVLGLLIATVWVISIWDIFRHHLGAMKTTAWLLIVLILPLVGSVIYWAMRKETEDDVEATVAAEAARREELRRRPVDSGYGG